MAKAIFEKGKKGCRFPFNYGGKQYRKRYAKAKDKNEIKAIEKNLESLVTIINTGHHLHPELGIPLHQVIMTTSKGIHVLPGGEPLKDYVFREVFRIVLGKEEDNNSQQEPIPHLSDLIEKFLQHSASHHAPRTQETIQTHLKHLQNFLGKADPCLLEINVGFFNDYKLYRKDQGMRNDTVNRELTTFQSLFELAVEYGYAEENVVKKVKRGKSQTCRKRNKTATEIDELIKSGKYNEKEKKKLLEERRLSVEEVKEYISLAEGTWLYPVLLTFAHTGIRKNELINLEWKDVDLEKGFLEIKSKKGSKKEEETGRSIPIHEDLFPVLRRQKEVTGEKRWVFVGPKDGEQLNSSTLGGKIYRMVENTKFRGMGCHAFRHALCSYLRDELVPDSHIDYIVGHRTKDSSLLYGEALRLNTKPGINKLEYL